MERLIDLLIYFFTELSQRKHIGALNIKELLNLGYSRSEISLALSWILERLGNKQKTIFVTAQPTNASRRYLHKVEKDLFTSDGWSKLNQLYTLGIITLEQMEILINKATIMGLRRINAEQVKKIVSGFIFDNTSAINLLDFKENSTLN